MTDAKITPVRKLKYKALGLGSIMPPKTPEEQIYHQALVRTWAAVDIFTHTLEKDYKSRLHKFMAHELKELMTEIKKSVLLEEI
jgi:hypothetical protein